MTTFTDRTPTGVTVTQVASSQYTTWLLDSTGHVWGCGQNSYGQQSSGSTDGVTTFTGRGPPGSINIQPVTLFSTPMAFGAPLTATPITWHAGGEDWMLTTSDVLTLYHASISTPMVWDSDTQITIANGHITATYNGSDVVLDVQSVYYRTTDNPNATASKAKYVITDGTGYIYEDGSIIAFGMIDDAVIEAKGPLNSVTMVNLYGATDPGFNTEAESPHEGILNVTSMTISDGATTGTPMAVIIPDAVQYIEMAPDETMQAVVGLIPLLLVIGIVVAIVGMMFIRRE